MKQFLTEKEAIDYCAKLPISEIVTLCGKLLFEKQLEKQQIVVSEKDMETILSLFRVRGVKKDGTKETRGRIKVKKMVA